VKTLHVFARRCCFACAWCHFEFVAHTPLHSAIGVVAGLHLFLNSVFYVAGLF